MLPTLQLSRNWGVGDQITISLFKVVIHLVGISLITKYRTSVLTACRSHILIFSSSFGHSIYIIGSLGILSLGAFSVCALLTCHSVIRSESSDDVSFHV